MSHLLRFHQAFSKSKTRPTSPGCGGSERIAPPWTMTSLAAPYGSTTRRASSANLMCLRDWCTSSCTPYEAALGDVRTHHRALETPEMRRCRGTSALAQPRDNTLPLPAVWAHIEGTPCGCCIFLLTAAENNSTFKINFKKNKKKQVNALPRCLHDLPAYLFHNVIFNYREQVPLPEKFYLKKKKKQRQRKKACTTTFALFSCVNSSQPLHLFEL